jgi:aldehyde dehydrogenase (NAD+)
MSEGVHRASKTSLASIQGDPMNMNAQAEVAKPQPYSGFDRLPIGGEWRRGKMRPLKDIDPYTDEVLLEIPQADRGDLDDAYAAAARAQTTWAQEPASTRGEVFRVAAHVMETRRDEIVSWLIHESGSTRLKANLEWASSHAIML